MPNDISEEDPRSIDRERAHARRHATSRNDDDYVVYVEDRMRTVRDALRLAEQGDLSLRLPTNGTDDGVFVEVALAFNALAERVLELKNTLNAVAGLEQKAKQLTLVSKYKSEFLANMSHELRTPLNSVIILSNLLVEGRENLTQEQLDYARIILSSGRDLLGLIDQILDLSKIEAGKLVIERKRMPLDEVLAYAEQHFRPLAEQADLEFKLSIAPDTPEAVSTDPRRLQQILKNLLSNAFKFTETGSIELRIGEQPVAEELRTQALGQAEKIVSFSVADSGIGIPPEKQELIFEAFHQAATSTARLYGGTGLGLTISRELSRLLGGELHVRSEPGSGSTFTLYLPVTDEGEELPSAASEEPLVDDATQPGERLEAPTFPPELAGKKIAVVDDDVRDLFAITSLLEKRGARVLPAGSANEAFDLIERNADVMLILMDMMMPETDGYDATRTLRSDRRYRGLPIIALTAKAMAEDRDKALDAGCDDFVPKPVEPDRLLTVIRKWTTETPR